MTVRLLFKIIKITVRTHLKRFLIHSIIKIILTNNKMKSFAFAAALIAATQAVELEWGYSQPSYSYKPVVSYSQAAPVKAASAA